MNLALFDKEELLALIHLDLKRDNLADALEKTKFLLAESQIPVEAFSVAGRIYATLGLLVKAQESFEKFLQYIPNAAHELFQLGMVKRDMGDLQGCVQTWIRVLDLDPNYPDALFYLGETYMWLGQPEEARDSLYKLLEVAPDNSRYIALADDLLNRIVAH